ncbi:MAG: RSP_2648 family PIN domain-containing protein [Gemmobacter sp.]
MTPRVVLDACVLYPTGLRGILLRCAGAGLFVPLWSARILEEWARATRKLGPGAEAQARSEIAAACAAFPAALVPPAPGLEARLHLPDPSDIHVLATAAAAGADAILTFNAADFPRGTLAAEGIARRDPDGFLWELWSNRPGIVAGAVDAERTAAEAFTGMHRDRRSFLRRLRLPRLGKAMAEAR